MNGLRKNSVNILLFLIWLGVGLTLTTARAETALHGGNKSNAFTIDLTFVSHLDADLPVQDVFIEREANSGEVFRVTIWDKNMDAPLYKAALPIPHNPFDARAVGPHPKGKSFGMNLGEWLQHQGGGTYTCANGKGHLDAKFSGLVENGIYTIWHTFTAIPATTPFSGFLDLPLGARDGSTSVFVADEHGRAAYRKTFEPCLQMSDVWTTSLLAVNYHSEGRTYAGRPGAFGYNVHVPLFVILPLRSGIN